MWTNCDLNEIQTIRNTPLSESTRGLLIGTSLGDGCLRPIRNQEHAYLKVGNKGKLFVEYKLDLFSEICKENTLIKRWEYKGKESYHFNTIAHPDIYKIYSMMYINGVKIITEELFKDLTIAGLALWYLDDGYYRRKSKQYFLSTCNFTLEEHHMMREQLRKKFDVYTSIIQNQTYYKLYIASRSREQFEKLLSHFIPPCMQYKYGAQL